MVEWLVDICVLSARALWRATYGLAMPALIFIGLALIIKRGRIFAGIRGMARETRVNLMLMAGNAVIMAPVLAVLAVVMTSPLRETVSALPQARFWAALPAPVVVVAVVVIGDFIGYWRHRIEHHRWFWPGHEVHHSDTHMTWLAVHRVHPLHRVSTYVIDTGLLILLGLPAFALLANNLVRRYYGYLVHADLPWTYGSLGRVFVSPAMHRWHHANEERAMNKNFAQIFAVFDVAFGTFYVPGKCTAPLGVTGGAGSRLIDQLLWPFRPEAYRRAAPETRATSTKPVVVPT